MKRDRTFPTLTAVRGIGAVMVVGTHSAYNTGQILRGWTGGVLTRLDFGVTLFFVLSGFLLSRPYFLARARSARQPSTRHYLWKRALRVMPLYWLVVVVALLGDPANKGLGWEVWARQLTLTQLYFATLLPQSLTQMWSLCTEVAFYLVLPGLCWVLAAGSGKGLNMTRIWTRAVAIAVLGIAWQAFFATIPGREGHYLQWLPGYLPWFLVGMVFAATSADLTVNPRRTHVLERLGGDLTGCWLLATALFAIACTPVAGPRTLAQPLAWEAGIKDTLYTLAGALYLLPLVFGPEREGRVREILSGRFFTWLGDISYGIYAIHLIVMARLFLALDIVPFTGRFWTILLLDLAITCALATASFKFFERPILRLKNITWMMRIEPPATRLDEIEFARSEAARH